MDEWMWERDLFPAPIAKQNEGWYNQSVSLLPSNKVTKKFEKQKYLENLANRNSPGRFYCWTSTGDDEID